MTKPMTEEEKAAKAEKAKEDKARAVKEADAKAEKAQRAEEAKAKKKAKADEDLGGFYHFGINHRAGVPFKFLTIGGHNWQRRTHIVFKQDDETERSPRKGMMLKLPHATVVAMNAELDRDLIRTTPWGTGERWDPASVEFEPMKGDKSLRDCVFFKKVTEEQFQEWKDQVTEIMEMAGVIPVETGTEVVTSSAQRSANDADRQMDDFRD